LLAKPNENYFALQRALTCPNDQPIPIAIETPAYFCLLLAGRGRHTVYFMCPHNF